MSKASIGILTLGCKVNQYESEAIAEELQSRGFVVLPWEEACNAYVVNTCTVTAEADRKSRQMIRRLAKNGAAVFVTGCTTEYSALSLAEIDGVMGVCGNAEKLRIVDMIDTYFSSSATNAVEIFMPDIEDVAFEHMSLCGFPRTRVYIKIEDGCENKCTYCAIPGARGKVRSKVPEDVLAEISSFVAAGCREIVLTGIETASYGKDLDGYTLKELLFDADGIVGDCKIRLGSLEPTLFKPDFLESISSLKSLCHHFHISLQSGSSGILALMKRKYNRDMALDAIRRIKSTFPDCLLTTDVITGFPGESEEDHELTMDFLRQAEFLDAHIFPYSERAGTPAATMPQKVDIAVRRQRASEMSRLQREISGRVIDREIERQSEREVLFETYSDGFAYGHTDSFLEVAVASDESLHGQKLCVRLTHREGNICHGLLKE